MLRADLSFFLKKLHFLAYTLMLLLVRFSFNLDITFLSHVELIMLLEHFLSISLQKCFRLAQAYYIKPDKITLGR